jgi:hypothetical protein
MMFGNADDNTKPFAHMHVTTGHGGHLGATQSGCLCNIRNRRFIVCRDDGIGGRQPLRLVAHLQIFPRSVWLSDLI